ncbi:MAG: DNA polymerase III subunit gamma/tau [Deltaproteobacteria bacterium]|nr:DNA polymerase III subunit gamma/tau [Deltaproteobacteria bacterium]
MSYLVLARKWRPQRFDELVGQEHVARTLENAIKSGRIHHAFLFCGPRGVGKTSAARILAKALNCEAGPAPIPCGQCQSCREITQGTGVDVFEIDGASNTGVDDIRELRDSVRYLPTHSRFKIFIIDEVHMLSINAFNALLKVLEEPPPHAKFIFATTESHKIPATILSRCQRFDFRRLPVGKITAQLTSITGRESIRISPTSLHLIARQADGSMRDALSTLDQVIAFGGEAIADQDVEALLGVVDRRLLLETAAALLRRDAVTVLDTIQKVDEIGFSIRPFCKDLIETFRALMLLKVYQSTPNHPGPLPAEAELLQPLTELAELADLQRDLALLLKLEKELSFSSFPQIALETGLLAISHLPAARPLGELIEQLAQLELRIGGARPPAPAVARAAAPASRTPNAIKIRPSESQQPSGPEAGKDWPGFMAYLNSLKPMLATQLGNGRLQALTPSRAEIAFQENSFELRLMKETATQRDVEELLERYFGRKMTLAPISLAADEFRAAAFSAPEPGPGEKLRRDALDHPAVKSALKILGGEAETVIPLNPGTAEE